MASPGRGRNTPIAASPAAPTARSAGQSRPLKPPMPRTGTAHAATTSARPLSPSIVCVVGFDGVARTVPAITASAPTASPSSDTPWTARVTQAGGGSHRRTRAVGIEAARRCTPTPTARATSARSLTSTWSVGAAIAAIVSVSASSVRVSRSGSRIWNAVMPAAAADRACSTSSATPSPIGRPAAAQSRARSETSTSQGRAGDGGTLTAPGAAGPAATGRPARPGR